jgi:hypothetical protein
MDFIDAGPATENFLLKVKKECMMFSYGEWEGLKVPDLSTLQDLRNLLDLAIQEAEELEK